MLVEIPPRKIRDGVAKVIACFAKVVRNCLYFEQKGLSASKNTYSTAMNPRRIRESSVCVREEWPFRGKPPPPTPLRSYGGGPVIRSVQYDFCFQSRARS